MDYNVMAIIAIIASVGLLTVTIAAALPTMIAFAKGDHSRSPRPQHPVGEASPAGDPQLVRCVAPSGPRQPLVQLGQQLLRHLAVEGEGEVPPFPSGPAQSARPREGLQRLHLVGQFVGGGGGRQDGGEESHAAQSHSSGGRRARISGRRAERGGPTRARRPHPHVSPRQRDLVVHGPESRPVLAGFPRVADLLGEAVPEGARAGDVDVGVQIDRAVPALGGGEFTGPLDHGAGEAMPPVPGGDIDTYELSGAPGGVALGDPQWVRRMSGAARQQPGGPHHLVARDGDDQAVARMVEIGPLDVDDIGVPGRHVSVGELAVEGVQHDPARPVAVLRQSGPDGIRAGALRLASSVVHSGP